jgi:hypothetical protein
MIDWSLIANYPCEQCYELSSREDPVIELNSNDNAIYLHMSCLMEIIGLAWNQLKIQRENPHTHQDLCECCGRLIAVCDAEMTAIYEHNRQEPHP